VLSGIGMDPASARECLRFTFGWDTAAGTGVRAAHAVLALVGELG